jgi:hypothetical protein
MIKKNWDFSTNRSNKCSHPTFVHQNQVFHLLILQLEKDCNTFIYRWTIEIRSSTSSSSFRNRRSFWPHAIIFLEKHHYQASWIVNRESYIIWSRKSRWNLLLSQAIQMEIFFMISFNSNFNDISAHPQTWISPFYTHSSSSVLPRSVRKPWSEKVSWLSILRSSRIRQPSSGSLIWCSRVHHCGS